MGKRGCETSWYDNLPRGRPYIGIYTLENQSKESTTKVPEEEPTGRKKGRWLTWNKQEKQRVKSSPTPSMRWVLSVVAWNKRVTYFRYYFRKTASTANRRSQGTKLRRTCNFFYRLCLSPSLSTYLSTELRITVVHLNNLDEFYLFRI